MNQTSLNQGKITRNDLIAFKSATDAAPTTEMQVNRLMEKLQSSVAHIRAVAVAATTLPSKNTDCDRKGGHVVLTRSTTNVHFCSECGAKVTSSTDLRRETFAHESQKRGGRSTNYWLDGHHVAQAQ